AKKASDTGISDDARATYNEQFQSLRDQITTIVNSSSFNDTNLLKTSGGTISALQSLTAGDNLTLANQELDLPATETTGNLGQDSEIDTAVKAAAMETTLKTLSTTIGTTLSNLGAASRKIDSQVIFTSKLSDTIESGIGNLVDADLAKESARLQALQVKQQLGVQALSIANQAPQTIVSLFR
ncbi:MAG TPA: flagellin, partial [Sphingomonas sp.]